MSHHIIHNTQYTYSSTSHNQHLLKRYTWSRIIPDSVRVKLPVEIGTPYFTGTRIIIGRFLEASPRENGGEILRNKAKVTPESAVNISISAFGARKALSFRFFVNEGKGSDL